MKINKYTLFVAISVVIFMAIVFNINKYQAELISTVVPAENFSYCYEDLDNDGNSEYIEYIRISHDKFGLIIFDDNKIIEGQWNFSGKWATTWNPFIVDYDNDGIKEIFVFTVHNDSIFLHCLDAINRKIEIENKAVCKVYKERGEYDFKIRPCTANDVNADGFKELFFSIETDYATRPRNMYAYYPKKDSILVSPKSCSLVLFPEMFDLDGDSTPEFITTLTYATGNCKPDRKYTDQYSWLMVFTPKMEFKFPPVRFNAYPAISRFIPFNLGNKKFIIALHFYEGSESFKNFIALIDYNGNIIRQKNTGHNVNWYYSKLFSRGYDYKEVFILLEDGTIMEIDSILNMHKVGQFDNISNTVHVHKMDIDCDGINEFIFPGKNKGEIIIYRNDFLNPVTLSFNENIANYQISIIKKEGGLPKIFVDTNEYLYTFSYETTTMYKYRYIIFIPILLFLLLFNFIIEKIKHYRELKIANSQKQISELQVKAIQNQLDPHFTFNVFVSFADLINEKDTEKANYIFDKYAGLLKASVFNSGNILISLQDELDFVANYLELEKFRYPGKFSFHVNIQENIDMQASVPKMILHIFVENALKHGIKHLNSGGKLLIKGARKNGAVSISITDNGVGRAKAKEYASFSTGKGLGIMDQILEYYYMLNKIRISYKIIDLYENNKAAGTEVKIRIPIAE